MISIITTLKDRKESTILLEYVDKKSFTYYSQLGFDTKILNHALRNSKQKKDSEKLLTFYGNFFGAKKLVIYFPKKDTFMDDRSEQMRKMDTNTLFIPSTDFTDAYECMVLATYRYDHYITEKEPRNYTIYVPTKEKKKLDHITPLLESIIMTRDLVNKPPTDTRPEAFIADIKKIKWKHFKLKIIDAKELKKLGCNLLLAVGSGSDYPPYMVILERIIDKKKETYALIGKGVTFDAGGIQIKSDTAMFDMKCDMSGAAGMLGVARYLDTFDTLPVNVVIGLGITENMTGGKAFKPLDIYRSYNGKTVEIHHTDAEGRLVLADVMGYIGDIYAPEHMITMATLTGACIYALGYDIAGIMGDDEPVINALINSKSPYEKVWRLPLNEKFKKSLKAEIADLKNVARSEKAGSSIGGAFLSYFQGKSKFTHIDIAGPAYRETAWGYMPKGATGWGVKILSEFILGLKK